MSTQKPKITLKQMNQLQEKLEEAWWNKTPFVCADGTCSDRIHTTQANVIWDFFHVIKDPDQ
jgi:hypothetical protein|tara:strand:- start:1036 stop:1221 length:186 start_codon:yes stop_codon:yes gene_type:complete